MRVFIAEKPSLAKAIAEVLPGRSVRGEGYIEVGDDRVTWCFGHLMRLADAHEYDEKYKFWKAADLPILPDEFKVKPNDHDAGYIKQINIIGRLVRKASHVIHAGDADREGHLLVQWVLNHVGVGGTPVSRLWLSANDPASVKKALAAMKPNAHYDNLYLSGECRSFADWMVGINLSRAYSLAFRKHGSDHMVSVGRVQSPTLALIVERDRTIENFIPKTFFVPWILVEPKAGVGAFKAKWLSDKHPALDDDGHLVDKDVGIGILKACTDAVVKEVKQESKKEAAPLPYRLASLQAACSSRFGLTADKSLAVVQSLYEKHKLVSYPRTDCDYLPESQHAEAAEILKSIAFRYREMSELIDGADASIKSRAFNDKKISAHHAIIPTRGATAMVADLSDIELKVYDMIVRAYVAQFYPPHLYDATRIDILSGGQLWRATGRVTTDAGWRAVIGQQSTDDEDDKKEGEQENQALPEVTNGEALTLKGRKIEEKATKPPGYYTDGSLLLDMENIHRVVQRRAKLEGPEALARTAKIVAQLKEVAGIGTDATRSNILKLLTDREYACRVGKTIRSTDLGREVIDALPERVKSPEMTALFEQALGSIGDGSLGTDRFIAVQQDWVSKACQEAESKTLTVTPYKRPPKGEKPKAKGKAKPAGASKKAAVSTRAAPPKANPVVSKIAAVKSNPVVAAISPKVAQPAPASVSSVGALTPVVGMDCPECHLGKMLLRGQKGREFLGCSRYPDCKKGIRLEAAFVMPTPTPQSRTHSDADSL